MYALLFLIIWPFPVVEINFPVLNQKSLNVDIHEFRPLVNINKDKISGFEVDLLRRIASEENIQLKFRVVNDFQKMFEGINDGTADIALSGISILEHREKKYDFSLPTLRGGLSLLVHSGELSIWQKAGRVAFHLCPIIGVCLVMLLSAFGTYRVERKIDSSTTYMRELWEAAFFCTTLGFISNPPKTNCGRAIVLSSGLSVIGLMIFQTALLTSYLQSDGKLPAIGDHTELVGKLIATVQGSSSEDAITDLGAKPVGCLTLKEAIEQLRTRKVSAVMFDSVELKYHVNNNPSYSFLDSIRTEDYGFVFPQGSELREMFNRALLRLQESGEYDAIRAVYRL